MALELTKMAQTIGTPVKVPHTIMMSYRTNTFSVFGLPSMDFVEQFFLILYWNKPNPMESVVELRARRRSDQWWSAGMSIDPKLLREILSEMPRYRDAIVELAPGRSFIKGLCGEWVASLDTYRERAGDTLAGSLLFDHGEALAMALSFPGKIKSLFLAERVHALVNKIDTFVREVEGNGRNASEIKELKKLIAKSKRQVEELDTYTSEDFAQYEKCKEFIAKFGIDYDISEKEVEDVMF